MPNAKPFPLYTDGSAVFYTTDGVNFTAVSAPTAVATPSANGLMSAAQFLALAGLQASGAGGTAQFSYSDVIDLVGGALATYQVIPPTAARMAPIYYGWEIKTTTAATVSPTYSGGTNSTSFNNLFASQTPAGLHTGAAETVIFPTAANPLPLADLTASGFQLNLTGNATATALTARFFLAYFLLPV